VVLYPTLQKLAVEIWHALWQISKRFLKRNFKAEAMLKKWKLRKRFDATKMRFLIWKIIKVGIIFQVFTMSSKTHAHMYEYNFFEVFKMLSKTHDAIFLRYLQCKAKCMYIPMTQIFTLNIQSKNKWTIFVETYKHSNSFLPFRNSLRSTTFNLYIWGQCYDQYLRRKSAKK
jgi:hypothetical protein